jgi:hypothetical protein
MENEMTEQEAIDKLNALTGSDTEADHSDADEILLEFLAANGHQGLVKAWDDACERTGGFWYA